MQQTIALLKPDTNDPTRSILLDQIQQKGLRIAKQTTFQFTRPQARSFYRHMAAHFDDFEDLITQAVTGTTVALLLEHPNAISHFKTLIGPEDPQHAVEACEKAGLERQDWTWRAFYGTDRIRNAIHGSETGYEALRQRTIVFPLIKRLERTIAVIKPDAVFAGHANTILQEIQERYQCILIAQSVRKMTAKNDVEFVKDHDATEYCTELHELLKSGDSLVLVIDGMNAITQMQLLAGPVCPSEAKKYAPKTLRAKYGSSTVHNAIHVSRDLNDATLAYRHWFPTVIPFERTLGMIESGKGFEQIRQTIADFGFQIVNEKMISAQDWKRIVPKMTGKVHVMILARQEAVLTWNTLIPELKRHQVLIYGSKTAQEAQKEIKMIFGTCPIRNQNVPLTSTVAKMTSEREKTTLHTMLTKGLSQLCKEKPQDALEACEWLGNWLLSKNEKKMMEVAPLPVPKEKEEQDDTLFIPSLSTIHLVAVIGAPGSGKTTQSHFFTREKGYFYIDTTKLVESEPVDFISALQRMIRRCGRRKVVLDGFPADLSLYFAFEKAVASFSTLICLTGDRNMFQSRYSSHEKNDFDSKYREYDENSPAFIKYFTKTGSQVQVDASKSEKEVFRSIQNAFSPYIAMISDELTQQPSIGLETWKKIAKTSGLHLLSLAELIQERIVEEDCESGEVTTLFRTGEKFPDEIIVSLYEQSVAKHPVAKFLLIDLPSSVKQAEALERAIGKPQLILRCCDVAHTGYTSRVLKHFAAREILQRVEIYNSTDTSVVLEGLQKYLAPRIGFLLDSPPQEALNCLTAAGYLGISPKDLLRAEIVRQSSDGIAIEAFVQAGKPVPSDMVIRLLRQFIFSSRYRSFFILDFPRTRDQAESFEQIVTPCTFAVSFEPQGQVSEVKSYLKRSSKLFSNPEIKTFNNLLLQTQVIVVMSSDENEELDQDSVDLIMEACDRNGYRPIRYKTVNDNFVLKFQALRTVLQNLRACNLVLIGFPASLEQLEEFETQVCAVKKVIAMKPREKASAIAPHEMQDDYSFYSDEEDDLTKAAVLSPLVDEIAQSVSNFYQLNGKENNLQQLHRLLQPELIFIFGHESSEYLEAIYSCTDKINAKVIQDLTRIRHELLLHSFYDTFLINRFNRDQLLAFRQEFGQISKIISFTCSREVLLQRSGSESVYNLNSDRFALEQRPYLENFVGQIQTIDANGSREECAKALVDCLNH